MSVPFITCASFGRAPSLTILCKNSSFSEPQSADVASTATAMRWLYVESKRLTSLSAVAGEHISDVWAELFFSISLMQLRALSSILSSPLLSPTSHTKAACCKSISFHLPG
jgi:hypothetical protein